MSAKTEALLELDKAAGQLKSGDKLSAALSICSALQIKLGQLYAKRFFPGGIADRSHQVPGPAPVNDALAEAGVYTRATHRKITTWLALYAAVCKKPEVDASADEFAGVVAAIRLFFATVKEPVPLPPATYSLRLIADILADAELTDSEKLDKIRTAVNTGRSGQETPIERRVLRDLSSLLYKKPAGESGLFIV